jgi:hypothetical protein
MLAYYKDSGIRLDLHGEQLADDFSIIEKTSVSLLF